MTKAELKKVLRLHGKWLRGEVGGKRADLSDTSLRYADLRDADLRDADLRCADLSAVNLSGANLSKADLRGADLHDADLHDANLSCADLSGANMSGVSLNYAPNVNRLIGQPVYQVAGVGKHRRAVTLLAIGARKDWRWFAGCFKGSEDELRAAVAAKYTADSAGYRSYMLAIDFLSAMAGLNADMDKNTNPNPTTQQ